jgi:glucose-6-phosphate isomerase
MNLSFDISRIVRPEAGLAALNARFAETSERLAHAVAGVKRLRDKSLPHFTLPTRKDDLEIIGQAAEKLRHAATDCVVFGVGGSSLGGQALAQLDGFATPAYAPRAGHPRMHFVENLDSTTLDALFRMLDLRTTRFVVISKSGATIETLTQSARAIAEFKNVGAKDFGGQFVAITEVGSNPLREMAREIGCTVLDHDPALGGRYSVLSAVGLLPAAIQGLDCAAIRAGANSILVQLDTFGVEAPWAKGAALNVAAAASGYSATVLWAYADRLERFVMWWRQLWGESLGKQGQGLTPIRALGPVDQHSQLQLYLDGPKDKFFTVLTMGDASPIVRAQARATVETLAANRCPVRTVTVSKLDEAALGALFMHFMLETMAAAELMGVDPFGQPAVEQGKVLTRKYLDGGA